MQSSWISPRHSTRKSWPSSPEAEIVWHQKITLQWFTDYLFQRSQIVKLGQERSSPCPLVCGVPQGSILGPVLFLLFFDDFNDCIHHCNVLQFADDRVIFVSSKKVCDIENLLNSDLNSVSLSTSTRTNWLLTSKRIREKVCCLGQQNVFHLSQVIWEISSCSSMIIQSTPQTPTLI